MHICIHMHMHMHMCMHMHMHMCMSVIVLSAAWVLKVAVWVLRAADYTAQGCSPVSQPYRVAAPCPDHTGLQPRVPMGGHARPVVARGGWVPPPWVTADHRRDDTLDWVVDDVPHDSRLHRMHIYIPRLAAHGAIPRKAARL